MIMDYSKIGAVRKVRYRVEIEVLYEGLAAGEDLADRLRRNVNTAIVHLHILDVDSEAQATYWESEVSEVEQEDED